MSGYWKCKATLTFIFMKVWISEDIDIYKNWDVDFQLKNILLITPDKTNIWLVDVWKLKFFYEFK